jgi:hypothetical protein
MLIPSNRRRNGYRLDDFRPIEDTKAVTVPTLVAQVHDDFTMPPSHVQAIYDNISAEDKRLFWIEGTDLRFQDATTSEYKPIDLGLVA